MRRLGSSPLGRFWWAAVVLAAFTAFPVEAQDTNVVSSQVMVSAQDAQLELEFGDGGQLVIALEDGRVLVDGVEVGTFAKNEGLDRAWRDLLSSAIPLTGDELVERLHAWSPPEDLTAGEAEAALRVDQALEGVSLSVTSAAAPNQETAGAMDLVALLRYADQLGSLGDLLDDLELDDLTIRVGEDLDIAVGESVTRDILVAGADLNVEGRVDGDVILIDGELSVAPRATIDGNVRLLDARIDNDGEIQGRIQRIRERAQESELDLAELREQIRADIERELERGADRTHRSRRGFWSPFRNIAAAVGGILENLLTFGVLCAIGAVMLHFGGGRMEVIASTARNFPARSAAVGLAGAFLFFPAWILGIVALAITIIGIPVAIAWTPLFPLAAGLLAIAGALAVAMNVGQWVGENRIRGFEWASEPNQLYRMAAGLLGVTLVFVAANAMHVAGSLLGFLHGLLAAVGCLAVMAMTIVGFGAVLLSRAGARPDIAEGGFSFDEWRHGWRSDRWYGASGTATHRSEPDSDVEAAFEDLEASSAAEVVEDLAEDVAENLKDMKDNLGDVVDEVSETVGDVVDEVSDVVEDIVDDVLDGDDPTKND